MNILVQPFTTPQRGLNVNAQGFVDSAAVTRMYEAVRCAKQWTHFPELVALLRNAGHRVVQIGGAGDPSVAADEFVQNPSWAKICSMLDECDTWVAVDSFLQHANDVHAKKPGVVIWSKSNPLLFGYAYNRNLLKSREQLRPDQWGVWLGLPHNESDFPGYEDVFREVQTQLGI